jgi:phospholipase/carboxylesterase
MLKLFLCSSSLRNAKVWPSSRRCRFGQPGTSFPGCYGEDVRFIEFLIDLVVKQHGVDSSRLALAGFSDGASYALTLGLKNGDVFSDIIAFSPGFFVPDSPVGKPHVFISHGSADRILPIAPARGIADRLEGGGYHPRFEEFEGGHEVPRVILEGAVHRFLRRKPRGKA